MAYRLSKSKIISGMQCRKRLYLEIHRPDLIVISAQTEQLFQTGFQVGDIARQLFAGGNLVESQDDLSQAIEKTKHFLENSPDTPLYEGTFSFNGILIRADILEKATNGYRLVEVKSSTQVKDYHRIDAAIQTWVIEGSGYPLERAEIGHIDNSFVYQGNGNYSGLLKFEDITEAVKSLKQDIPGLANEFVKMLEGDMPCIEVGVQCFDPFECPFYGFCAPETTEFPVHILPWGRKVADQLIKEGIEDVRSIPEGRLQNPLHEKVRRVTISGMPEVNNEIHNILKRFQYPRYYLDFETIQFAVPIWKGTRPYQQLPFQWSCHVEESAEAIRHEQFLDISGEAPMRPLAEALIETLDTVGPIFSYSPFENGVIDALSRFFPDLNKYLENIKNRLVDLLPILRRNYYHPDMKGSWSIKMVLPTIAPDMNYGDLQEVQDGTGAQMAFLEAIHRETHDERRRELKERMLKYCELDSLAMVKLVKYFG